jgi:hypothetical protein
MKLSEIKTALDKGEQIKSLQINVKSYLPLISKTLMVLGYKEGKETIGGIIDECIDISNNGIAYVNHFKKDMAIVCAIINWYSDITIDEVELDSDYTNYDYYMISGLWEFVKNQLGNEYNILADLIDKSIEEELRKYNSIESIINNNLNKLIDKLPTDKQLKKLTKTLVKDINSMNWDKVPMIKQMFETSQGKNIE